MARLARPLLLSLLAGILAAVRHVDACSSFVLNTTCPAGPALSTVSARTMDFDMDLNTDVIWIPRGTAVPLLSVCYPGCAFTHLTLKYGFAGFNCMFKIGAHNSVANYTRMLMEATGLNASTYTLAEGMNEAGLSVSILFDESLPGGSPIPNYALTHDTRPAAPSPSSTSCRTFSAASAPCRRCGKQWIRPREASRS